MTASELSGDLSAVSNLISRGRFLEAHRALSSFAQTHSQSGIWQRLLASEIALELGDLSASRQLSSELVALQDEPIILTRAYRVHARSAMYCGDVEAATQALEAARLAANMASSSTDIAEALVWDLNFTLGFYPIEAMMLKVPAVRRAVHRSGCHRLAVLLRLCIARTEARRQSVDAASMHLGVADDLLLAYPNPWLQGTALIDHSVIGLLKGDLDSSVASAEQALEFALVSGHYRTLLAAHVNLSHVLALKGELATARRHSAQALEIIGENRAFLVPALDNELNLSVTARDFSRGREVIARLGEVGSTTPDPKYHWDILMRIDSKARLHFAEGRISEAEEELGRGIEIAPPRTSTRRWRSSSSGGTRTSWPARPWPCSRAPDCAAALALVARREAPPHPRHPRLRRAPRPRHGPKARRLRSHPPRRAPRRALADPRRAAARPRAPLHLIAIRKLIDTAVTLDRYRRDENSAPPSGPPRRSTATPTASGPPSRWPRSSTSPAASPRPPSRSSSPARPAPARKSSPAPSTAPPTAPASVPALQLHRRPPRHARKPAVRPPQGRLHRRRHRLPRRHPVRRRRHALPRRDRRGPLDLQPSSSASSRPTRSTRSASRTP
jgi:tetratricopeptide (TPR) repeat protein